MANRRQVLFGLVLALGGPAAVARTRSGASAEELWRSLGPAGPLRFYSRREFEALGIIADAIIPRTDTPGAIDAGVPAHIDAMIAAWASKATRREQRESLAAICARLRDLGGGELTALPDAKRRAAVAALDTEAYQAGAAPDQRGVAARYRALKELIAQVYYSTEIGATQELHYELVPGRWLADAPLSQVGRTWAF